MAKNYTIRILMMVSIVASFHASFVSAADFALNFNPEVAPGSYSCAVPQADCVVAGGNVYNGGSTTSLSLLKTNEGIYYNDGTRFIQEKVYRDGEYFFHVIIGDPANGFANEFYSAANNTVADTINEANVDTSARASSLFSGGNERELIGNDPYVRKQNTFIQRPVFGNAKDPFGLKVDTTSGFKRYDLTGNGTGDPATMVMRLLLSDAEMSQEVLKPLRATKPRISQTTSDGVMTSQFVADMRSITYSETNRVAPLTNIMTLNDAALPVMGAANFDMSLVQKSNVTAGQFSYTAGQGWLRPKMDPTWDGVGEEGKYLKDPQTGDFIWEANPTGWDTDYSRFEEGSYAYADGGEGFAVYDVEWGSFFDVNENAAACQTGYRSFTTCPN